MHACTLTKTSLRAFLLSYIFSKARPTLTFLGLLTLLFTTFLCLIHAPACVSSFVFCCFLSQQRAGVFVADCGTSHCRYISWSKGRNEILLFPCYLQHERRLWKTRIEMSRAWEIHVKLVLKKSETRDEFRPNFFFFLPQCIYVAIMII